MKMRKNLVLLIFVFLFLFSTVCSAASLLPKEQIAIGGITIGMPLSDVQAMYGKPFKVVQAYGGYQTHLYSTDERGVVDFGMSYTPKQLIDGVSISGNKGLSTPAGVKIGMTYSEVVQLLGEPYYIEKGTIGYYGEGDSGSLHIDMDSYSIDGNSKVTGIKMNTNRPRTQPTQQQPVKKNTLPTRVTQINKTELNIGGINRGQAMEYVEQVYGKPNVIDDQGFYHVYNYNDLFIVRGKMNSGYKVDAIVIYDKNLGTPSGFKVGTSFEEVIKKYGQGQTVKYKFEGIEKKFKGCKVYIYFCGEEQIVFIVDKNQIIRAIKIEPLDGELFREYKK